MYILMYMYIGVDVDVIYRYIHIYVVGGLTIHIYRHNVIKIGTYYSFLFPILLLLLS